MLDVDVKGGGLETAKTLEIPPTLSQRTISGGIHYFYRYPTDGKTYGNKVKFLPGLDVRGEGGYVMYYGADNTAIANPPHWLLEHFKAAPQVAGDSTVRVSAEIAMGVIQKSLDAVRDAAEGESNNVLNVESFRLGQLVASQSITREYAEAALYRAAIDRGKPPYEAQATIRSGLDGGGRKTLTAPFQGAPVGNFPIPDPPAAAGRYTPSQFTRDDLLNTSRLRRPQLFEHWSTADIHITTADGGTGKTTLKLFEAICLALGERFLGFPCITPGKTLFITGEDSAPKLGAMIGQIVRQMGFFNDAVHNDKINTILSSVIVKKDADLCIISKNKIGFLQPDALAMTKLLEAVDDHQPKMIVFDPISCFWGSEMALNDMNKAVTKFMSELAERSGACVEMINHMGKQASANKDMSQFAGRGGSGLPSNARVSRVLRQVSDEEYTDLTNEVLSEKQSAMLCNVNKFTDGSPLYNKQFLILRDGFLFSRKALTDTKAREAERQLTDQERVFSFIKEARAANKYASVNVCVAHFMTCGNPLPGEAVKRALNLLVFQGHMGEKLKIVENPDQTQKDKVFVITDIRGVES